jgi:hypothetical protein
MTQIELLRLLAEGVTTVTFTKKDGTERVMKCTRNPSFIPMEFHPKNTTPSEEEVSDNIRAFDVEKLGWRSFNFSTVRT